MFSQCQVVIDGVLFIGVNNDKNCLRNSKRVNKDVDWYYHAVNLCLRIAIALLVLIDLTWCLSLNLPVSPFMRKELHWVTKHQILSYLINLVKTGTDWIRNEILAFCFLVIYDEDLI